MVGQDHPRKFEAWRQLHLKRITFDLFGYGAQECQTDFAIIGSGRQDNRRPPASLLMSGLGLEIKPYDISSVRDIRPAHQISRPCATPVTVSV